MRYSRDRVYGNDFPYSCAHVFGNFRPTTDENAVKIEAQVSKSGLTTGSGCNRLAIPS